MPLERLEKKTTRDVLWVYILKLLTEKKRKASEINEAINTEFGFKSGTVTSHVVIFRLENSGYIKATWEKENDNSVKFYEITDKGKELFEQGKAFIKGTYQKLFSE